MPHSAPPRAAAPLSDSVHQLLNMYARAAAAAGVGILALAPSAHAKIIYTPANIPIPVNGGLVGLDLNNDGTVDFEFSNVYKGFTAIQTVRPDGNKSRIWWVKSSQSIGQHCAGVMQSGSTIGHNLSFAPVNRNLRMAWASHGDYGCPWYYVQGQAYLGLKFRVKGVVHFGWARVQMSGRGEKTETITGYAYESIGHKKIIAGKTTGPDVVTRKLVGLGHLARGAAVIQPASPIH
jgi:hypothetical protein